MHRRVSRGDLSDYILPISFGTGKYRDPPVLLQKAKLIALAEIPIRFAFIFKIIRVRRSFRYKSVSSFVKLARVLFRVFRDF